MTRLWATLHVLSGRCGVIPLVAAVAFVAAARLEAMLGPEAPRGPLPAASAPAEAGPEAEALSHDLSVIDEVLARRAPELGLTLRRQVGVAIAEEARAAGYDPLLVLALIDVESDFAEDAVSSRGAKGLMQIQPATLYFLAQREGIRLSREEVAGDPALCVRLGIRYLRYLNDRFRDLDLALMAYNAGPTKLRRFMKEGNLEPFQTYPRRVRREFRRFRHGVGLDGDWALALRSDPYVPPSLAAPGVPAPGEAAVLGGLVGDVVGAVAAESVEEPAPLLPLP